MTTPQDQTADSSDSDIIDGEFVSSDDGGDSPTSINTYEAPATIQNAERPTAPQTYTPSELTKPERGERNRQIAEQLISDQALWLTFYDRCECLAAAELYGHKNAEACWAALDRHKRKTGAVYILPTRTEA